MIWLGLTFSLLCFSGNSLLCRIAVGNGWISSVPFTVVRLMAGALTLFAVASLRRTTFRELRQSGGMASGLALFAYAIAFSLAYSRLDAGIGALVLFSSVQATMFGVATLRGVGARKREWLGLLVALSGLAYLVVPGKARPDLIGVSWMGVSGIAWGFYTLRARTVVDARNATVMSFLVAAPLAVALLAFGAGISTPRGIALAILSGAVTSGMGYTVWYSVVPRLGAVQAAISQLATPGITLAVSVVLLGETATLRTFFSLVWILGGVALALTGTKGIRIQ